MTNKIFKIIVWRGVSFKTSNLETVKRWKDRQQKADANGRFQFPIKIKQVHKKAEGSNW